MGNQGSNQRRREVKGSPFAGCSLVIAAMVSMLFLVGYVIWSLFRLDSELSKFTADDPALGPEISLVEHTAALNVLKAKLNDFEKEVMKGEAEARLALSAEELNLAITAYEPFEKLRRTFTVQSISDGRLRVQISFPMNGKPMSGKFRYLNGSMIALPRLTSGEIVLEVDDVLVPGATVPEGFLGQLSPHRITERYKEDAELGPWMAKLTAVNIEGESLVMVINPKEKTPTGEGTTEVRSGLLRALGLFVLLTVLFLLTVILVIVFRKRRKRDQVGEE